MTLFREHITMFEWGSDHNFSKSAVAETLGYILWVCYGYQRIATGFLGYLEPSKQEILHIYRVVLEKVENSSLSSAPASPY